MYTSQHHKCNLIKKWVLFGSRETYVSWKAIIGAIKIQRDDENDDYDTGIEHGFLLENITPHPEYRNRIKYYDVALVKLNDPVELNSFINIICLPVVRI